MKQLILVALLMMVSFNSHGVYNANYSGRVSHILTYADGDYIYIILENQPTSHPGCKPEYFVISDSIPLARRQFMLSRLLTAYTTKEIVNIGYDDSGDCAHGYIRVHRVG